MRFKLARMVVEATGRREYDLVVAAAERGLPVVVAQPLTIRRYAAAKGVLAKADRLDAQVLADYGATLRSDVRPIPVAPLREMRDLAARCRQLVNMSTMEKVLPNVPMSGAEARSEEASAPLAGKRHANVRR